MKPLMTVYHQSVCMCKDENEKCLGLKVIPQIKSNYRTISQKYRHTDTAW